MKEVRELPEWRDMLCSWIERLDVVSSAQIDIQILMQFQTKNVYIKIRGPD